MSIPIDPHYIPAFSIEDVLLDKDTGAPLSGGLVYFERDSQRGTPKPVYQITGTSPDYTFIELPNPVVLSSIGTFEDSMDNPTIPYFYPYDGAGEVDLYYIRVTSAGDVPQFDRQAQPFIEPSSDATAASIITNELSNPQFVEVNFDTTSPSYTYNVDTVTNQIINIAPSWDLVVTAPGAGTITVSQLAPEGILNIPTNPATILDINSTGLTTLLLRQRLFGSPNLWGSGNLAVTFLAKTYANSATILNMYYSQSNGSVTNQLLNQASLLASGVYDLYPNSVLIPASTSLDTFPNAYVDIFFNIPVGVHIAISSVMVAFTGDAVVTDIQYEQESEDRQIDHLFHYYEQPLNFKPVPSLLTGWDFALNPRQFGTNVSFTNTGADYTWDQTICQSFVSTVNITSVSSTAAILFQTTADNEAFFMMQYLTGVEAFKTVYSDLSVNLSSYSLDYPGVEARIYLFYSSGAGTIPLLSGSPSTIGTIAADGTFALSGSTGVGWSEIPLLAGQPTTAPIPFSASFESNDIGFTGWNGIANFQATTVPNFAIVVTFTVPTSGTRLVVNSISLTPGEIPTRPAPQTYDEVLRECQYYYETNCDVGVIPSNGATNGVIIRQQQPAISGSNYNAYPLTMSVSYHTLKRLVVTPTVYTTAGLPNSISVQVFQGATSVNSNTATLSGNWSIIDQGQQGFTLSPVNRSTALLSNQSGSPSLPGAEAIALFNYTADARLGKV